MISIRKGTRAGLWQAGLAALVMGCAAGHAAAQGWRPERQVEITIGTSPGGPQDRQGRLIQRILQERKLVEQPVTVVNRPGGGGASGLAYLMQHRGEGQLMQVVAQPLLSNEIAGRSKQSFRDLTPLAIFAVEYVVLAVRPDSPIRDAREFIERLRKDPTAYSISIGTTVGNATHTSFAHAMRAAGVDIKRLRTVAFNSGGESITATMGGHIDAMAGSVSTVIAQVRAGHLRVLAVGAPQRVEGELAKIPTWKEMGVDSAQDLWRGLAGPPGLSAAQVAFWDATMPKVVKDPEWQKDIETNLMVNVYKNSTDTLKHWQGEYADVKAIFTEMGLAK